MAAVTLPAREHDATLIAAPLPLRDTSVVRVRTQISLGHVIAITAVVWLTMRLVFFVGFVGSDDMYYVRFAAMWDRAPVNHWESRLLFNAMTRLSMLLFGRGEWAAVLPCLIASLACVVCVVAAAVRWLSTNHALWAGLLAATLPIDVEGGTTVSAYTVMTGFLLVGTLASLRRDESNIVLVIALASFALGVLTHRIGVFYVGAFGLALAIGERNSWRFAVALIVTTMLTLFVEHTYYAIAYGDFGLPFRTALGQSQSENPEAPLFIEGTLNSNFITWPFMNLIASKAFGLALVVGAVGLWQIRRTIPKKLRVLFITGGVFWLWMNFGSQIPWEYCPFWRMTRFWYPLMLPATLFASIFIANIRRRWASRLFGASLVSCHVMALMCSGAWGQNAEISRELLSFVRQHPESQFITDYHTLNEMYTANGIESLPNVASTEDVEPWKLLDPKARRVGFGKISSFDALLINPRNVARERTFAGTIDEFGGNVIWKSKAQLRTICAGIPQLASSDWAVKKPSAMVQSIKR